MCVEIIWGFLLKHKNDSVGSGLRVCMFEVSQMTLMLLVPGVSDRANEPIGDGEA